VDEETFAPVRRIDGPALARAVAKAGGPRLELVEPLAGGAVGAWLVRWPDAHLGVLTWAPPPMPGQPADSLSDIRALVDIASRAGIPVPRHETVVAVGGLGAAILQEHVPGCLPETVSPALIEQLIDLADARRGLLAGTGFSARAPPTAVR
jgi:hypothetical protein